MPVSSGYFQFKFEKTWGELNKPNDDIFALHAKSLYDGVMSIPFYERNDLKPSLFNEEHINRMNKAAELNRKQYEHNLPLMSQEKELALKMTNLLRNEKPKFSEDTDTDEQQSASRIVKRTAFLAIGILIFILTFIL